MLNHVDLVRPIETLYPIAVVKGLTVMNNENNMHQTILSHLKEVELQNKMKVLLAVESGSRTWGFHSAESDWDYGSIYIKHNKR